ncbi:uncharacterized protein OCT59_009405 [Rhizophagus irregularis]|nr:hypothetical protein OCT59_009405 [Rhizophagus irregularis]CAB4480460.1 unnamed protein product [Rhizophagus irregularis]
MLESIITEWIRSISEYYRINRDGNYKYEVFNIDNQLKNDMLEFVEANKALVQEQTKAYITQNHSQAYYTSRNLLKF